MLKYKKSQFKVFINIIYFKYTIKKNIHYVSDRNFSDLMNNNHF